MLPLLTLAGDGNERSLNETIERLAPQFGLSEIEKNELLPSGMQRKFDNRVSWARTICKKLFFYQALVADPRAIELIVEIDMGAPTAIKRNGDQVVKVPAEGDHFPVTRIDKNIISQGPGGVSDDGCEGWQRQQQREDDGLT